jgi:hypothetical protein
VFLHGGTAISWKSSKQTLIATSTNHSKIILQYLKHHDHGTVGAVPLIYTNAELYDHKRKHIIFDNMKGCMKQHPISEFSKDEK